ncbi:WD40-repeat-containing domain protein [Daedaleopsis nitida]|nr:WD40-repeat-containing domain protein [Daedaleopsis nitida]
MHQPRNGPPVVTAPKLRWRYTLPAFPNEEGTYTEQYVIAARFTEAVQSLAQGRSIEQTVLACISNLGMFWILEVSTGLPLSCPIRLPYSTHLFTDDSTICFPVGYMSFAWTVPLSAPVHGSGGPPGGVLQTHGGEHSAVRVVDLPGDGARATELYCRTWAAPHTVLLRGHEARINALAFFPDHVRIATASADSTVRLWSARNGECLEVFHEHTASVTHVLVVQDSLGYLVVSGSEDGRVWARVIEEHTREAH